MYDKILLLFCVASAAFGHGVEFTTPFPVTTPGPVITSYSSPATLTEGISNTYLPTSEVKIGSSSNAYSAGSSYVPVHSSHSVFKPVAQTYGHSLNQYSTTQATPTYTTSAPAYSTTPSFHSRFSFGKSYPVAASYVKSTIAPSYSYSFKSANQVGSYPSHVNTYVQPVAKSSFGHSYGQPLSYYQPTVSQVGYSAYPAQSIAYIPSSTPAPSVVTSTLGYSSSTPVSYSVSPTVASYSSSTPVSYSVSPTVASYSSSVPLSYSVSPTVASYSSSTPLSYSVSPAVASYSTPSPSYSIQAAPLKAQFSYAVPSPASYSTYGGYSGGQLIQSVGLPYHGTHGAIPLVAQAHYPSYSTGHSGSFGYSNVPVVSHGSYNLPGAHYNW